MNLTDIIDEAMRAMGKSDKEIADARMLALSRYCVTKDDREHIMREIPEELLEHYRALARLFLLAMAADPSIAEKTVKELMKERFKLN